jgi:hypothetical protein
LCEAVTLRPLSRATNFARLTSSSNKTVTQDHGFTMRGFGKRGPGAESHKSRYFSTIDENRDIFAGETDFVGAFLSLRLPFKPVSRSICAESMGFARGIRNGYN